MGSAAPNPETRYFQRKSRKYFIAAYVALALLAITSSLGGAFVYGFFGLAVFLLFLGIRHYSAGVTAERSHYRHSHESAPGFLDSFLDFISRKRADTSYGPGMSTGDVGQIVKKIVRFIFSSIAIFMFAFIGFALFSGNDEYDYLLNADSYYQNGRFDSAYMFYHKALRENEASYSAMLGLAKVMRENQNYDSSLYYYDAAIANDPDAADPLVGKAELLYDQQRYDEAIPVLEQAYHRDQYNGWAYILGGNCHYYKKNYDAAIVDYERGYELGQRSKALSHTMGYIYDVQGKMEQAIASYEEALTYEEDVNIRNRLAELQK